MSAQVEADSLNLRVKDPATTRLVALVCAIALILLVFRFTPLAQYIERERMRQIFESIAADPWSGPLFVASFCVGLCIGLPATPFTLVGGVVFGLWPGALYNWLGTTAGAGMAFLVARYFGRPFVQKIGDRLQKLDEAVARNAFWAIFTMRTIPIIPFNLSNFAAGLTRISFWQYMVATGLAIMPGLTIFTFFADRLWRGEGDDVYYYLGLTAIMMLLMAILPWMHQRRSDTDASAPLPSTAGSDPD